MKQAIAVSNIAWTADEDAAVARLLSGRGVRAIEVAPARLFADPASAADRDIQAARSFWADHGISLVSMQALLFGGPNLTVFGDAAQRQAFTDYMTRIIVLAGKLGCGPLVFGSPKARLRGALPFGEACERAAELFRPLAAVAADHGCVLSFEPNAAGYGCDFVNRIGEAASLARLVDHPGFRIQLDTGNFSMEGDSLADLREALPLVAHFHASSPHLEPLSAGDGTLRAILAEVAGVYEGHVTIEMRKQDGGSNVEAVAAALDVLAGEMGESA